jgi:hypothetical protein
MFGFHEQGSFGCGIMIVTNLVIRLARTQEALYNLSRPSDPLYCRSGRSEHSVNKSASASAFKVKYLQQLTANVKWEHSI